MIDEELDERDAERRQIAHDHNLYPLYTNGGTIWRCTKHGIDYREELPLDGECPRCHSEYEAQRQLAMNRWLWPFQSKTECDKRGTE